MSSSYAYLALVLYLVINFAMRALPFVLLKGRTLAPWLDKLSENLPGAIMAILVVYSLRATSFIQSPFGIPEVLAVLTSILSYLWKRNLVVTLLAGSLVYIGLLGILA